MALRLSKKTSIISIILLFLVLGGSGGYLLWRTNQPDTVAPTDSEAGCVPVGTDECLEYEGTCDEARNLKGCGYGLPAPKDGYSWCQHYEIQCTSECGDKVCEGDETVTNCPKDCAKCGDNICSSTENLTTCPKDCSVCGDNQCTGSETVSSCPNDCSTCGDKQCTGSETVSSCPEDCACVPLAWTNKPSGTYSVNSEIPTITITNPNSTSTDSTGINITLNGIALTKCLSSTSSENCFNVSTNSAGVQVVSINLFRQKPLKEGTYPLSISLPGKSGICSESASFIIATTTAIPQTGIFDGTIGRIYLGIGFVFLGLVTTQTQKVVYMYNSLSERGRIIQREREVKSVEKRRNRFERKF